MSLHMSERSFTSDNDDEPIYFTPTYKPEDLICEGSDTEANPRAIIEKRRRYGRCAERVLRGQLPIIESARLRGPFYKENKNEWVNPWRHREGDWWKPGSKDMLFRREDVMRRAREHGRKDMNPNEALAWCRRDAKRQAKEMGVDDGSGVERDSATRPERESFLVDETLQGDTTMKGEVDVLEGNRSLTRPPLPKSPESTCSTHACIQDFEDIPIMQGLLSNKGGSVRQPGLWTSIKRPVDVAWLKGSHVSKRARWEDPAISSPTPLPHAISQKLQQKVTGTTVVTQNRTTHVVHPRSGFSLETPRQELASPESSASLQQPGATFDTETSFHTNIGQQGRRISACESGQKPANLDEDSPEPYSSIPFSTLAVAAKPINALQPSATIPLTLPRLPSHSRIGAVHDENHETPGNVSFITDVAPSSVNLEQFEFRKKRRCKTDPPEVTSHPMTDIEEDGQVPSSGSSRPNPSLENGIMLSTPFILRPMAEAEGSSLAPIRPTESSMTKGSSRRSSQVNESWLTTQEEIRVTQSTRNSAIRSTAKEEYFSQYENVDNSWVTTQDDFDHAPLSSASLDITQIYRSSNLLPRPNLVEHMESPTSRSQKYRSDIQSSGPKQPSTTQPVYSPSNSPPHLPALVRDSNKRGVPSNNLDGSSTQSCNTSPVSSIKKNKLRSPQTHVVPQKLGSSQKLPPRTTSISNEEFTKNAPDDNLEKVISENVQKLHDSRGVETKEAGLNDNIALEGEQIGDVTVLQANQELDIHAEMQADLAVSDIIEDAKDVQGVTQVKVQEEVQDAMRADPDADGVPSSVLSSGQTSTSSSPARTNNLTIHNLTSIPKARNVDEIPKSSLSIQFKPLLPSEEDILSPASTQDPTEYMSQAATREGIAAISSEDTGSFKVSNTGVQSIEQSATQNHGPQSPWAPAEAVLLIAPVTSEILAISEMVEPQPNSESPHSGWQKKERPVTPDNDFIRPFSDLMAPSPLPGALNTPEIEPRPSNTQLLVEAATKNPWVNESKKTSAKRKRVSFGVLDDEDSVQSRPSSQRQRRSPSPESTYLMGAFGSKLREFDDGITDMNSFQNHFSAIRKKSEGDGVPKVNSATKRPSSFSKYNTNLSGATKLIASSPATDAMAEAFIAADRDSSRERDRRLTISPLRNRKSKRESHTTFEDEEEDDLGIQSLSSYFSTNAALNETSSNAKLGDHTSGDFLDEVEDFLGGNWSVEGELRKATRPEFAMAPPKGDNNLQSRRSVSALEEKAWS